MPLVSGTRLGPFEILALIGAGGMGEVYRARDTRLDRDVAIKVLQMFATDSVRMSRFEREARVLASLNHPNIAYIYGVEEHALVMELVEGKSPEGPMPLEEAWSTALQIADALEYAHDKGIVHRDLKPANVKVTPEGVVKLLDFGLAKAFSEDPETAVGDPSVSPTMTLGGTIAGTILGTAAYMAPEQAKGKPVDTRADVWAWAVVLYELLTGERLFQGETIADTLAQVLTRQPDLNKIPAEVRKLLQRCLEKDPRKRLRDIGDAKYLWDDSVAEAHIVPSRSMRVSKGFRLATYVIAGVLVVALAAVSFLYFHHAAPLVSTLRYTIDLPENSAVHSFALSPNGDYLAVATSVKGTRQLWLRPLDGLQFQPMPNTEDARYPFWSPDSRYIGFFAQGKLRKIAAIGGPTQSLCDVVDGRGGSWNSDDVIVFSPNGGNESLIQRVSASGGDPSDVSKVRTRHLFPVFLPDGRHFLYETAGAGERDGIYVASLDGKEDRRILLDPSGVEFAPSVPGSRAGHLLFVRENKLMAQPFDAASLLVTGEVFPVADHVALANANNFAPVTTSGNGVLLYWTGGSGATGGGQQIVWYDHSGRLLGTLTAPGSVQSPAISPDEKTIAFGRQGARAGIDIWLRDLTRGTDRRFTSDPSQQNVNPIWSPQGDRIVFDSDRAGHARDLYQKKINGAGQDEVLLSTSYPKFVYQWSRDGRFIVYGEGGSRHHIWVLPVVDSGQPKPMQFLHTEFNEVHGQLSPDNRWMAYASDVSGQREVYARSFPSADHETRISIAGGEQPRWRGDGKELFYVAADRRIYGVDMKASAGQNPALEVGPPVFLFDPHFTGGVIDYFNYDVTADGKRFLAAALPSTDSAPTVSPPLTVVVNWKGISTK
jgi:eukaryotic-like serine/threonine-protein kinase